ncbi:hypothetical protein HWHPT5561_01615 [Petrotoga sp. HWH.PT.55.6.1]|uniref:flagellar hook-length control protein FliK n=1 Tax=unclassified Petrotoga TaxID=2620614 RepID=UPI000CA0000B|nr:MULTISPECIES: flagellar hook-length control protein FliK [unclassified Petrotoga]PNR92705.1 hypothetical protein X926_05510 [Petrotoga sp. HWHPT.55.6.3]RPD36530.1 hypothetical protein HWHPT5561_01615 [Petrotoga sp. HWH.PT.55.6.1]
MNVALTDLTTNLPKSKNINHFTANASNAKLESFDQKFQDIVNGINNEGFRSNNAPTTEKKVITNNRDNPSIDLLIKTNEKSNNELLVIQNTNDSKDLIISNTKKDKYIKLNVDQLLLLIEASTKNTKNIDEKELLNQAQKILSSSKTQFTEEDKKVLQKAFSIIIKESKDSQGSNTEIPLEGLIKHSKSIEESPNIMSQNNVHSKETNQVVNSDIQKLLQLIEESSKTIENKDEINTLEQAQKILSSSYKTEFTKAELETLQKALSIIIKESKGNQPSNNEDSKAINSQIPLESLIKHSKSTEESLSTLSQQNLYSKVSKESDQDVQANIQKLLQVIEKNSKSIENKDEINTLEQAKKILSSSKTQLTEEDKEVLLSQLQELFSSLKIQLPEEDKKELLIQTQKILSSSKTELTKEDKEVLQKAFSIIMKETKASNTEIPLESLIKHSKSTEESLSTLSQQNLYSKVSKEANQDVQANIQKLLQLIEKNKKSTADIVEINTLEQAQKILSSPNTQLTEEDKEVLQKAFNIIMRESKDSRPSNSEILLEGLIKHSKPTEETSPTPSQQNLYSKVSKEANQDVQANIQKLLQLIEKNKKSTADIVEINTLEQAQKILSSSKTEFTKAELEILQKALSIIIKESKGNQPSNNEDSKAINSQIPLESLIKHSKSTEESLSTLSQNNLHTKVLQESDQDVQANIQKLLQVIEKNSKSLENKDEINTLEQAQKILISSKTELTKEDKNELLIQAQETVSSPKIQLTEEDKEILLTQVQELLSSSKTQFTEEDKRELLNQAQKILSSSKIEFKEAELETLQKAFNIIIKGSKVTQGSDSKDRKAINSQTSLDDLIKRSQSTQTSLESLIKPSKSTEKNPTILSQNNLHSKGSQETTQIAQSDIQKLLSTIQESSKNTGNKNEIHALAQAQNTLISSKTDLTKEDKEILLTQLQEFLPSSKAQLAEKEKNELLKQAQKILSSTSKIEFTPDELNIIKTALGINTNNNSKMGNSSSNLIGETTLTVNSLIKGNTDKTKNNKNENNDSIKAMQSDQKADLLNTKNNLGKNVYFDPYETRKNNVSKDKNSELQKDNTVKLTPTSNLGDISKNLNIEQLKIDPSTNEIGLKSLQINKNNIQDGIPTTNLKDLNAQIKEVIISKNTQTFLNESFSVKISPPDLGKVDIQILKNGQAVTVNISTETENAKNIISKTLQSLVGNLRDEGYQPISIKVNVTQEEHYLADQNQQHQQEQEQKKYNEEDHNGDQSEEGTYYTFDEYLRSDLNA